MEGFCPTNMSLGLVADLLGSMDCNVRLLSETIYRAVSGPGSELAWGLTLVLTIYVAVMGLRLMFGMTALRISDFSVAALKIGLVLALATNWPVYQEVIFNALFQGPEQIVNSAAQAAGTSATAFGEPFVALQRTFDELQASAAFFAHSPGTAFAASALNLVSYMLLFSTLGAVLVAKAVLGLMLALGPVFATLLLLDSTRGIFVSWLRVALGFSLVPSIVTLALVGQTVLVDPYIASLAQMRTVGQPDAMLGNAVFVLIFICSSISLAALAGIFIVALGLKLPTRVANVSQSAIQQGFSAPVEAAVSSSASTTFVRTLAEAIERRDARSMQQGGVLRQLRSATNGGEGHGAVEVSFASAYRHAVRPRQAASSMRRDG